MTESGNASTMATAKRVAAFAFHVTVGIRHTDLDILKNVNNVALAAIFEEARTLYSVEYKLKGMIDPLRRVIDHLTIRFFDDGRYPGALEISVGVASLAVDKWTLELAASQSGKLIAVNECTFGLLDEAGSPAPLPDALANILRGHLAAAPV